MSLLKAFIYKKELARFKNFSIKSMNPPYNPRLNESGCDIYTHIALKNGFHEWLLLSFTSCKVLCMLLINEPWVEDLVGPKEINTHK